MFRTALPHDRWPLVSLPTGHLIDCPLYIFSIALTSSFLYPAAWTTVAPRCAQRPPIRLSITQLISCPHHFIFFRSLDYGGSQIRPEATGFGTVIFALAVLKDEVNGPGSAYTSAHGGCRKGGGFVAPLEFMTFVTLLSCPQGKSLKGKRCIVTGSG